MATESRTEKLEALLTKLEDLSIDEIVERPDLGELSFEDFKEEICRILEYVSYLRKVGLDVLPEKTISQIFGDLTQIDFGIESLRGFNISRVQTPKQTRDQIYSNISQHFDNCLLHSASIISFYLISNGSLSGDIESTLKASKASMQEIKKDLSVAQNLKSKLSEIVSEAEDSAGRVGVARFSKRFNESAESHRYWSGIWILISWLVSLGTVYLVLNYSQLVSDFPKKPETAELTQYIFSKVFVISTLSLLSVSSMRNYRSHKHLEVVNRHRADALETFKTFVEAAGEDQDVRNAVLLEATRCAFAPAVSGYLKLEEEQSHSRVVEILKTAGTTKTGP